IAAGGIATGKAMHAVMILGADVFQLGTSFAMPIEGSSYQNFKQDCVEVKESHADLTIKELAAVRIIRNKFFDEVQTAYQNGASVDDLKALLGRARAKRGMFEGNLEDGELEIGQIVGLINEIKSVNDVVNEIITDFEQSVATTFSF